MKYTLKERDKVLDRVSSYFDKFKESRDLKSLLGEAKNTLKDIETLNSQTNDNYQGLEEMMRTNVKFLEEL